MSDATFWLILKLTHGASVKFIEIPKLENTLKNKRLDPEKQTLYKFIYNQKFP